MLGYNEMLGGIKPSKIICYGKPFDEMKGDIIEVDYGETNNLSKGFFVKKTFTTTFEPLHKGGGSASGQSSGNPEPENNDNINCLGIREMILPNSPVRIMNGEEKGTPLPAKELGLTQKPVKLYIPI